MLNGQTELFSRTPFDIFRDGNYVYTAYAENKADLERFVTSTIKGAVVTIVQTTDKVVYERSVCKS